MRIVTFSEASQYVQSWLKAVVWKGMVAVGGYMGVVEIYYTPMKFSPYFWTLFATGVLFGIY